MTAPAVVIEVAAPHATSPHVAALVGACSRAVPEGECVLSSRDAEPAAGAATAIVAWDGPEHRSVRIEVGVPKGGQAAWLVRDLEFRAEDQEVERWRSVGLVIATLVGESRRESEPPPPVPPPPALPRAQQRADHARPQPPRAAPDVPWLWLDGAAFVGPALDDGTWKVGAIVRGTYVARPLPVLALAGLRYGARPADEAGVGVAWASGSIGLGGHLELAGGRLQLDGRAELVAEVVIASVRDPATDATDSGSRWIGAVRVGADAAWMLAENVGIVGGVYATVAQSGTVLRVRDRTVARVPPLAFAPSLGLRVALP